jgi:gas vesicle protein
MDNKNTGAIMGAGLATGLALGVALGLLYAPRPGRETRAIIRERALEIKEKAGVIAEDMKERAGSMMEMAKDRMHRGDSCM